MCLIKAKQVEKIEKLAEPRLGKRGQTLAQDGPSSVLASLKGLFFSW